MRRVLSGATCAGTPQAPGPTPQQSCGVPAPNGTSTTAATRWPGMITPDAATSSVVTSSSTVAITAADAAANRSSRT